MPINKIAVYQGKQWITQNIAVQSSDIIGNIQSSQIESLDSSKITGLNHSAAYAALAAVNTNGHLIVPSTPVLHTHLTGLTGNVQNQLNQLQNNQNNIGLPLYISTNSSEGTYLPAPDFYSLYIGTSASGHLRFYCNGTTNSQGNYATVNQTVRLLYIWSTNSNSVGDIGIISWDFANVTTASPASVVTNHDAVTRLNSNGRGSIQFGTIQHLNESSRPYRQVQFNAGSEAARIYIKPLYLDVYKKDDAKFVSYDI